MKQLTRGIHHISLKCTDPSHYEKTIHFYRDLYGMPTVRTWTTAQGAPCIMLDTGAGLLEISANAEDLLGTGALRHIAFEVESADECIEIARREGYRVIIEPKDVTFNSDPPYPIRVAFCIGPVGEEVEFFELR